MSKEVIELQVNNTICEAVGCFKRATTKIDVRVGQLGSIPLDLCIECVKKFDQTISEKQISNKRLSEMKRTKEGIVS
jgi:hypothetical protein